MIRHSISNKITLIFAISFLLVFALFATLYKFQTDKDRENAMRGQFQSVNYLMSLYKNNTPPSDIEAFFKYFDLSLIKNQKLSDQIISHGQVLFTRSTIIGRFSSLYYNSRYYLYLHSGQEKIMLHSKLDRGTLDHLWLAFLIIALLLLIITYVSIMRSLTPLRELTRNIRRFANGEMSLNYHVHSKDEIGEVACEFGKAAKKINNLIQSRQLFLRTIMHELKTPIGKGRIISEMLQDELQKKRLIDIFERLNILLNEFAKIEQLASKSYALKLQSFPLSSIIEQACDMLMLDTQCVCNEINENMHIRADFDLMSLAIKNLLDNALKYSSEKKVYIKSIAKGVRIANKGEKLKYPIKHYMTAFISENNSTGLGLYIVQNIIEEHGYELKYSYENDMHNFDIIYGENS